MSAITKERAAPASSHLGWLAVLGVLLGAAGLYFIFLPPLRGVVASRSWPETTCTILSSAVVGDRSSDSDTYRIVARYTYEIEGRRHEGDRYGFMGGSSSGRAAKQAVVDRMPPGAEVPCWYDPADPERVVLHRGLGWEMLFGLFPLAFLGFGVYGLLRSREPGDRVAVRLRDESAGRPSMGKRLLAPSVRRSTRVIGLAAFAIFWNGVVSIFVVHELTEKSLFLGLFLVPFVLVGLGAAFGALHAFLALFNPIVHLAVRTAALVVGGPPVELSWHVTGRPSRFRALTLRLVGSVSVTYTRGTDTTTDTEIFSKRELVVARDPREIRAGSTQLAIPVGLMHSFKAAHNTVAWHLLLEGDIPAWPDVDEKYPLEVRAPKGSPDTGYRVPDRVTDRLEGESAPPGDATLRIVCPRRALRPGERVEGRFGWQLEEAERGATVELRLFWRTAGKGTEDLLVVERATVDRPGAAGERAFSFVLPLEPASFTSRLASLSWGLELVVVGTDRATAIELTVGPGGSAVTLPGPPA